MNRRMPHPALPAAEPQNLVRLIEKYAGAVPRYTSYPTAAEFGEEFGSATWTMALQDCLGTGPRDSKPSNVGSRRLSLYVHLPFCRSLCRFCACNKTVPRDYGAVAPYLEALSREISASRALLPDELSIEEVHWGGGSPDFLEVCDCERLHAMLHRAFPDVTADADISVEIDPRYTDLQKLQALRALGFNRLSLGVQDFSPAVQEAIGRPLSSAKTADIVSRARSLGFQSINVDLVYGLPLQTAEGFAHTLEQILGIRPDRIAFYGYAHVTWLKSLQKSLEHYHIPTPAERIEIFLQGLTTFLQAGYRHIGMDHFALPDDSLSLALDEGRLGRNFMGYNTHRANPVLALGASAISSLPGALAQNEKDVALYERLVAQRGSAVVRGVLRTRDDQMRGELIEAILCRGVVDYCEFGERWEVDFPQVFGEALEKLAAFESDSLVVLDGKKLCVTPLGRLFVRNIASVFDVYLERHRQQEKPAFSQAV